MKNIFNVLRFEYKGFVSTKSFRIVSIIFIVAIILVTSIPQIAGALQAAGVGGEGTRDKAALILSGEALTNEVYQKAFSTDALADLGSVDWVNLSKDPPSDQDLSTAITNGEYLFALRYSGGTECEFFLAGNRINASDAITPVVNYITTVARAREIADLPASEQDNVTRILSMTAEPKITDIGGNAANNFLAGYILIMFMMYTIVGYSNYVSSSVVTEKTSKAMELLITSVKPIHLMIGKVVGVGMAALTQVGLIVASAVVGIAINMSYWQKTNNTLLGIVENSHMDISIGFIVLGYFLLGFFLYAFLIAAFASTVTKPEEAATVVTLPMVLVMAALLFGFLTLFGVLSKTVTAVLSYIPFFTPINMLARYTLGDAGPAQIAIGAGIMVAAIIVVAIIAAKIFRMGVMLYGVKASPQQIFKALKNS